MIIAIQKNVALILLISLNSIATTPQLPAVVIRNITNDTVEDITVSDRSNKSREILIAAGKTVDINLKSNNQNVAITGNMRDEMAEKAQFVIKKATDKAQEVYLNVNAAPGGVNDGSRIIMGTLGTIALKFLLAGKNGGYLMDSDTLKNNCKKVDVNIKLALVAIPLRMQNVSLWDITTENEFVLGAKYSVNEK